MAKETKDAKPVEVEQDKAPKVVQKSAQESVYSAGELAANAKKIFGTRQECVEAALRSAGKTECTVSEARKIVENFLKKEVK